ncbi:MAG: DUF4301 family protein [Rikenellaceae bacterium]
MNFTINELSDLERRGISTQKVEEQISNFKAGFPPLPVQRAAVVSDGIVSLDEDYVKDLAQKWIDSVKVSELNIEKFVPASGAATRMFKEYFEFVQKDVQSSDVRKSLDNIQKFAFYGDLVEVGVDFGEETKNEKSIVEAILFEAGLDYGKKPKALLKFHSYKDGGRTACEEHLVEAALYATSGDGVAKIHFTVSKEHLEGFQELIGRAKDKYEQRYGVKYEISYSQQKGSTDTLAVDMENEPFKTSTGELLFRPAGHGALIENLNDITADVIFIKTIDNVVPDHRRADTVSYKKSLAQLGLDIQSRLFTYLRDLDAGVASVELIKTYVEKNLGFKFEEGEITEQRLREVLNRPLRVCGMVKNEGEPGGGPFWVKGEKGESSVQIAESSQIAPEQKHLMSSATHFNPVDVVCFPRDYKGEKFDLLRFVDPSTGFISQKSFEGRELKAQELPGLWNGAMANFNTVFVEVPITTFSPVKVLGDLLREQHQ